MVTYTQERYTLLISTDKNAFLRPFSSINGSTDLTLVDQVYSIRLTGLQGNTAYYYRIQVENTAQNTNLTPIMNFTTPSPCKLMIINENVHVHQHVKMHVFKIGLTSKGNYLCKGYLYMYYLLTKCTCINYFIHFSSIY